MEILTQVAQFILSLSILIVLHELGHFIPARLFKTRVEKFYLFFDPWFSLFKIKRKDTEYGIGWLPLGGYVKISGMIDESMDKEQMKLPPQPWEFRAKPAWQRLIIMLGGVTVNFILGIVIFSVILFIWGEKFLPTANVKYGISCDSIALKMGMHDGDKIISVDGIQVENFNKIPLEIILNKARTIEVEREGTPLSISIPAEVFSTLLRGKHALFEPRMPCEVDSVLPGTGAAKAGLMKGDKFISINGSPSAYYQDVVKLLQQFKGTSAELKIERKGEEKLLTAEISALGKLGFANRSPEDFFSFSTREYSLLSAIPAGISRGKETFDGYLKQFKVLFTVKDAHKSLGGFISIGKAYDTVWNWQRFWSFTAVLSIILAFMNILPIPALDGGHVIFLLYEVITGRKPSDKFLEYAQYAGMALLFTLLIYANGNDIFRLVSGG